MEDVVRQLDKIAKDIEAAKARPKEPAGKVSGALPVVIKSVGVLSPWSVGSRVWQNLNTFASRVEDPESREKLAELGEQVKALLGAQAIDPATGVFNVVRLYYYLRANELDVQDAASMIVLHSHGRDDLKLDDKRKRIITEDMGFSTLPDNEEIRKYQHGNAFLGMSKDGRIVSYECFGDSKLDGLKESKSVEECKCDAVAECGGDSRGESLALTPFLSLSLSLSLSLPLSLYLSLSLSLSQDVEWILYVTELKSMLRDAVGAVNGKDTSSMQFWDVTGGANMGALFNMMECESQSRKDRGTGKASASPAPTQPETADLQAAGSALKRVGPYGADEVTYLVNFPPFLKMIVTMVEAGAG